MTDDTEAHFAGQIREAVRQGRRLRIRGSGSKDFLLSEQGRKAGILSTLPHSGIVTYEPEELFVTVRAGTLLAELEATLGASGQHLAFDPPRWYGGGTVGGMVAAGLSGTGRMRGGPVRDHVLGVRIMDGQGQILRFGGTVIKNVAGYDVSRIFCSSWGSLGLLLDITLKVLPKPRTTATLWTNLSQADALQLVSSWRRQPWPLDASLFIGGPTGRLWVRFSGSTAGVEEAMAQCQSTFGLALTPSETAAGFWQDINAHQSAWFREATRNGGSLWRLSLPPTTPPLALSGDMLIEWHGGLRWWADHGSGSGDSLCRLAHTHGGWATPFGGPALQGSHRSDTRDPATLVRQRLEAGVRQVFDPHGVFFTRTLEG